MSKMDAQRAMREARYARIAASGPTRREAAAAAGTLPAAAVSPERTEPVAAAPAPPTAVAAPGALCGHKSMNGRACTREAGHPQKSHRYG